MNARERSWETLKFGKPDRPFLFPQWFFEETIERWQSEGLPADVDTGEFFGFDRYEMIPVCVGLFPPFTVEVLEFENFCYYMELIKNLCGEASNPV